MRIAQMFEHEANENVIKCLCRKGQIQDIRLPKRDFRPPERLQTSFRRDNGIRCYIDGSDSAVRIFTG